MAKKTCQELLDEYYSLNQKLNDVPLNQMGPIRKRRKVVLDQLRDGCEEFLASKKLKATADGIVNADILST